MSARDAILQRLRQSQGTTDVSAVIAAHARGPQPRTYANKIERFTERARSLMSGVTRLASIETVPLEVERYLGEAGLEKRIVCWPELRDLDWAGANVAAECRKVRPDDLVGVTGAFAAIAETGTLVMASSEATPPALSLLPETHIAVLPASRIVATMEDAFALLREERATWPRAVNLVSGPSRTADIEQTVTLGAHGPYRVHIIIVGAQE
jgi:L-lactate dehydrogenase complex protein LldG